MTTEDHHGRAGLGGLARYVLRLGTFRRHRAHRAMTGELVELQGASLRYAGLEQVELAVAPGEIVALLGPSGSGKSSLLRLLMGLVAPDEGRVVLGGQTASEPRRILVPPEARRLGVVFQDLALWPHLTVAGNLAFGLRARGVAGAHERIAATLLQLGLSAKANARPAELSGGERQRVAVGRAHEPLSNLDVALKDELLALFADLLHARGAAALLARPATELAARVARALRAGATP